MKQPDLKIWLQYKNVNVVESFTSQFNIPECDAEAIFQDMLRFLWMSAKYENESVNEIDTPLLIIDEMWHTFVLFTKDYAIFCQEHLGHFFHHCPATKADYSKHGVDLSTEQGKTDFYNEKKNKYNFIFDIFGDEVFTRWYLHYPVMYTKANIKKLRI
jgi:hypothetical protein